MFSKMTIYVFASLGFFALLIGLFPYGAFTENITEEWETEYMQDKEAGEMFEQANVTAYTNVIQFNQTFGAPKYVITDGLPAGHSLQVAFLYERAVTSTYDRIWIEHHWPGFLWFTNGEILSLTPPYDVYDAGHYSLGIGGDALYKTGLEQAFGNKITNASYFEWHDSTGVKTNMFITSYNSSWTIGEAWDNGHLNFTMGYEIDWNQTGVNAFNLLWQILTFSPLNLGVPGDAGLILNACIAIPFWIFVIILAVKLVGAIWPFGSGVPD